MATDIEDLREHYHKLPDEYIEHLANYEANQLTPGALAILKEEINRRGLSNELQTAADIQVRGVSEVEHKEIITKISALPCPLCYRKQNYLNAFYVMSVMSFLILSRIEKPLLIACPECISTRAKSALIKNLFLGWWGIPWGPIRTIHSFFINFKAMNAENYKTPTSEFIDFVKPSLAAIKARIDKINNVNEVIELVYQA